jgi:hypothetical protein
LTPEQVADENYLAQLRLYRYLKNQGMEPEESEDDFVKERSFKRGAYFAWRKIYSQVQRGWWHHVSLTFYLE